MFGNIALDQIIKDISQRYSNIQQQKQLQKDVEWKRKTEIEIAMNNQPENVKFRKKIEAIRGELSIGMKN